MRDTVLVVVLLCLVLLLVYLLRGDARWLGLPEDDEEELP